MGMGNSACGEPWHTSRTISASRAVEVSFASQYLLESFKWLTESLASTSLSSTLRSWVGGLIVHFLAGLPLVL